MSRQGSSHALNIWNIYYKDPSNIDNLQKFIFDLKTNRYIQDIDPNGVRLSKVNGDSAIAWKDSMTNKLLIRQLGSFKESWNSRTKKYEFCGSLGFNFDPN